MFLRISPFLLLVVICVGCHFQSSSSPDTFRFAFNSEFPEPPPISPDITVLEKVVVENVVCPPDTTCEKLFQMYSHIDVAPIPVDTARMSVWIGTEENTEQTRLETAKLVVSHWDEVFGTVKPFKAMPLSFLKDASLSPEKEAELFEFMLRKATVKILTDDGNFKEALEFMHRYGTPGQVADLEQDLMRMMDANGCTSISVDSDGHKNHNYNLEAGCQPSFP